MTDPNTRYERGLDVCSTLAGSPEAGKQLAEHFAGRGALGSIAHNIGAGEIWSRPGMSRRDRSLVVISALSAMGRELELRSHVAGGLNHGLSVDEIDEIFVQLAVYAGMPVALGGSAVASQVFAERDGSAERSKPPAPLEQKDDEKRRADGLDVLSTLLGNIGMDKGATEAAILDSQGDMGALVMDYAFGDVWARPQLSRRDRSLVVISTLTALNLKHELEIHIGGALNHGVTEGEVEEMLIMMILYGGFPRAIDGMILFKKVLEARAQAQEGSS